ncbi:phage virion morphogenesis protein [Sorangium sp. So ce1389]|uniref:phage virion morphogenesis protein n=1 Tax=Sorangium sp. So ce1389 TaxID=3133336 RepID=UPI003F60D5A5
MAGDPLDDLRRVFAELADRTQALTPDKPGEVLREAIDQKFEQGGPGWPALAPSTLDRRGGAVRQILVDSGALRESMQMQVASDYVELFPGVPYGRKHVEGDGVPVRDFLDVLTDATLDKAADVLVAELLG